MNKINTPGLVIREQSIGEADRLITVLTPDHGLMRAFSRGAKNAKSKKLASTALLTYSDFTFSKTKDAYSVDEASVKEVFFELRTDVVKMALAQYFCELAYEFCEEEFEADEVLRLFLNSLYFLKSGRRSPDFVKAVTELRLLSLAGYMPALVACDNCGIYETDTMFFVPESGKLYCSECIPTERSYEMTSSAVKAMRHVSLSEFEKIFSFSISDEALKRFCFITENYLLVKTQRRFKTLDFYKTLKD